MCVGEELAPGRYIRMDGISIGGYFAVHIESDIVVAGSEFRPVPARWRLLS
jgi:hypothetical protein